MSVRTAIPAPPLKLPSRMPNGRLTTKHPLLWCVENIRTDEAKVRLADHMGVRAGTLFTWLTHCKRDRHFSLPIERVIQIGEYFNVSPALFRPDIFTE